MPWLIAIGILVAALLVRAGYRKSAIAFVAGVLAAGVAIYLGNVRQEARETSRIPASEIALDRLTLKPTFRSGFDLRGTVRNHSPKYRLDGFEVAVTLRDCKTRDRSACTVIGQASTYVVVTVASGAASEFVASLRFGEDKPKVTGALAWDYAVTAATANQQ